ncbi:MAG: hypothetical protein GC168_00430 [Candidatus Hydrogenedens sp.]|nr:hypothetical protein [Candidatus Hydrogenedens sp.]
MSAAQSGSWWSRRVAHAVNAPLAIWLIALSTTAVAMYQYPLYSYPKTVQQVDDAGNPAGETTVREKLPLVPYVLGVGFLIFCTTIGTRWAFVFNVLTVWIFPYETLIGVKPPLRGTILTLLHAAAVILLFVYWRYYWKKNETA